MNNQLRLALAARAYESGSVRLIDPDLAGLDHLVATRHGLFAVGPAARRLIAHGLFYGLTVGSDAIFAFEACDRPRHHSNRGRIVRFAREGARIVDARVIATGLDNGCHQIDLIDGRLCVVDTYNQRILRYPAAGGTPDILHPIDRDVGREDRPGWHQGWSQGYVHLNSLIAIGGEILLLLHNGADQTGRPSEIARFDADWRPLGRTPLDGLGCHNLAMLENGAILSCGSYAGELITTDGVKAPVCAMMTRGLSVDGERIVVGGSPFAERAVRDVAEGAVFFLDRNYRLLAEVAMPAPPMEIRRIDGRDRSLSAYLAAP